MISVSAPEIDLLPFFHGRRILAPHTSTQDLVSNVAANTAEDGIF